MAVVKGVNIPDNKRIEIALTSIYGIGRTGAKKLIERAGVSDNPRVKDLSEEKLNLIRSLVDSLEEPIEGDLRRSVRDCLLYTSPSPRDSNLSRMPSSA